MTTQDRLIQMYGEEVVAWLLRYGYLHEGEWTLPLYKDRLEAIECATECVALQHMTYGPDHVADSASRILRAHHALMEALTHINPKSGPLVSYKYTSVTLPLAAAKDNIIHLAERRKNYGSPRTPSKS